MRTRSWVWQTPIALCIAQDVLQWFPTLSVIESMRSQWHPDSLKQPRSHIISKVCQIFRSDSRAFLAVSKALTYCRTCGLNDLRAVNKQVVLVA